MDMSGCLCPCCKEDVVMLSTTNEFKYYCEKCDKRFTYYVGKETE